MSKRDVSRLYDMLDAGRKALSFVESRSRQDLDSNEMLALALVRLLEVIGEAARFVPDEVKANHPEIQWREIAATRNRLIHGYFSVDLDIVWSIVENDLPPIVTLWKISSTRSHRFARHPDDISSLRSDGQE